MALIVVSGLAESLGHPSSIVSFTAFMPQTTTLTRRNLLAASTATHHIEKPYILSIPV